MNDLIIDGNNKNDYIDNIDNIQANINRIFWFKSAGYLEERILINFPNLTELHCCFNREITNIDAIKHCPNLTFLACSFNNISSLEPLIHCKQLKELYCADNNISDLSTIENCQELTHLECTDNPIHNWGVIYKLDNLIWIGMPDYYGKEIDIYTRMNLLFNFILPKQLILINEDYTDTWIDQKRKIII